MINSEAGIDHTGRLRVTALSLSQVEKRVRDLAHEISASDDDLPTFGESRDMGRPHIEVESPFFFYVVVERGQELERIQFSNLDDLLYNIFRHVTFTMACDWELANRNEEEDSRRQVFQKQHELAHRLNPAWGERVRSHQMEVLAEHPFYDEKAAT